MFGNYRSMPQQNMGFQQPFGQGQFPGGNFYPRMGLGQRGFKPWGGISQSVGGQGFSAPGYPPKVFGQQYPQQMPSAQLPPYQGYNQGYNQGYIDPKPVKPEWEGPKQGGIKGFINNLMTKLKR